MNEDPILCAPGPAPSTKEAPAPLPPSPTVMIGRRGNDASAMLDGPTVFYAEELDKPRELSQIIRELPSVSGAMRHFMDLAGRARWDVQPARMESEGDQARADEAAGLVRNVLMERLDFGAIARRGASYKFYGFSVLEWKAARREDGLLGFEKVSPRAQSTITKWDLDDEGEVVSVTQNYRAEIPRGKIVYVVSNALNDTPEGFGILSAVKREASRLMGYLKIEGTGFESDIRGMVIGKLPYNELRKDLQAGRITAAEYKKHVEPIEDLVNRADKGLKQGATLPSDVFETRDLAGRPSSTPKYDVSLVQGGSTAIPDLQRAVDRCEWNILSAFGAEFIKLGQNTGSWALAEAKYGQFGLMVEDALQTLRKAFQRDLVDVFMRLNALDPALTPELTVQAAELLTLPEVIDAYAKLRGSAEHTEGVNELLGRLALPIIEEEEVAEAESEARGGQTEEGEDGG